MKCNSIIYDGKSCSPCHRYRFDLFYREKVLRLDTVFFLRFSNVAALFRLDRPFQWMSAIASVEPEYHVTLMLRAASFLPYLDFLQEYLEYNHQVYCPLSPYIFQRFLAHAFLCAMFALRHIKFPLFFSKWTPNFWGLPVLLFEIPTSVDFNCIRHIH